MCSPHQSISLSYLSCHSGGGRRRWGGSELRGRPQFPLGAGEMVVHRSQQVRGKHRPMTLPQPPPLWHSQTGRSSHINTLQIQQHRHSLYLFILSKLRTDYSSEGGEKGGGVIDPWKSRATLRCFELLSDEADAMRRQQHHVSERKREESKIRTPSKVPRIPWC